MNRYLLIAVRGREPSCELGTSTRSASLEAAARLDLREIGPKKDIIEAINSRFPFCEVGRDNGSVPSVDCESTHGTGDVGVIA